MVSERWFKFMVFGAGALSALFIALGRVRALSRPWLVAGATSALRNGIGSSNGRDQPPLLAIRLLCFR